MARAEALEWLCGVARHMANRPSRGIAHPCSAPCFDWEDNVHGASHANKIGRTLKVLVIIRRNMTADGSLFLIHYSPDLLILLSGGANPTQRLWVSRAAIRSSMQTFHWQDIPEVCLSI